MKEVRTGNEPILSVAGASRDVGNRVRLEAERPCYTGQGPGELRKLLGLCRNGSS